MVNVNKSKLNLINREYNISESAILHYRYASGAQKQLCLNSGYVRKKTANEFYFFIINGADCSGFLVQLSLLVLL